MKESSIDVSNRFLDDSNRKRSSDFRFSGASELDTLDAEFD
jgi:hypothetical protein